MVEPLSNRRKKNFNTAESKYRLASDQITALNQ
ncbi:hypothetical protein Pvag_1783 [Pantoea vagans C9-1]|nr:hypothetical protein Pvag_1783 [Pantoea vagans C9-1]